MILNFYKNLSKNYNKKNHLFAFKRTFRNPHLNWSPKSTFYDYHGSFPKLGKDPSISQVHS